MRATGLGLILTSSLVATFAAFGCSTPTEGSGSASAAVGENAAAPADLDVARAAIDVIAGDSAKCTECHTAGKDDIKRWGDASTALDAACLSSSLTLSALERVSCLRSDPTNPASRFTAEKLGLYAAGASQPEFQALFQAAYSAAEWQAQYTKFKTQAGMPAFNHPGLDAAGWAAVKDWASRGLPKLDDVLDDPTSFTCVPNASDELLAHMDQMKREGWGARLAASSTPMSMCGDETDPAKCLTNLPDLTPVWGPEGTTQTLREIRKLDFRSSYWVRSSPDGRFTAFGGSPSRIIDNDAPITAPYVKMDAPYDPGFFPNNDGFSYASTSAGGLRVCKQSVLLNALATNHEVTFGEAGCTRIIDTVYQSVGAALDGSLYFMATGVHTNDAGGSSGPLSASFGAGSTTTLTPMFNDGTKYVPAAAVSVKVPNEGDQQMSASNTLLITRFGQKAGKSGYHLRSVTPHITPSTTGGVATVTVDTKIVGTACVAGGKPQLSFDERYLAVHQYTDPNANPQGLPAGTSNIFMTDLKTGKVVQVTKVGAGQRALYPHFRADGWLYFVVMDGSNKESLVASDAALHFADQ